MKTKRFKAVMSVLLLLLLISGNLSASEEYKELEEKNLGMISGRIVQVDGEPFISGFVALFDSENQPPMDYGHTFRSPTMISFIGENGEFTTLPTPEGVYYLGAIKREKWKGGPPKSDETRYSAIDAEGKYLLFTIESGQNRDVGNVKVVEPESFPELEEYFTVQGKILNAESEAVPNALVLVKKDYNKPKADFISDKTTADGSYTLKIPPGKYFFIARESLTKSGRPKPHSIMGVLGHTKPIGIGGRLDEPPNYIIGQAGDEFKDVNITMFKVPKPDVRRKEMEEKIRTKEFDKADLPADLPLKKSEAKKTVESEHQPIKAENTPKKK